MSPEPKPRSMAAVTITVNSKALWQCLPKGRYQIWLNAGTSGMYPQVLAHILEYLF